MADDHSKKDKSLEELIEITSEYKRGLWNLNNACKEIERVSGLEKNVCQAWLKGMKRYNVTQIRGYSKEPERLRKGKEGTIYEPKK
tara:strand:- start:2666 stop:2923 length:258 start_codon:yes stop_codon:yes gene_type:complete